MADSTSRWAEALREVSGRFGELPGEGGYPAYLRRGSPTSTSAPRSSRRSAGGTGSVTVMGAISPPSGDFSEPVTSHTKRYVKAFWALDVKRAQARFYPAMHPLQSYAEDAPSSRAGGPRRATPSGCAAPALPDAARRRRRGSSAWRASSARTRCRRGSS